MGHLMIGSVMRRITCSADAPSTCAARKRSSGIALIALVRMSMPNDAPTKPLMRMTMSHGSDWIQ